MLKNCKTSVIRLILYFRQFIVLKLQQTSIVKTVTFGKFEKAHVCNVRKFKVYGGLDLQKMMVLLEGYDSQ